MGQTKTFQNFFQTLLIQSVKLLEVDIKDPTMFSRLDDNHLDADLNSCHHDHLDADLNFCVK